jgi:death-on-curing protein
MPDGELPTAREILSVHDRLEEAYDLQYKGVKKTAPTLKLRREVLEEAEKYDNPFSRAAILLFNIQSVHVFEDANKRTAWTVTQEYLSRCGLNSEVPQDDETVEQIIRRAGLFSTEELATWLETGEIDEDRLR